MIYSSLMFMLKVDSITISDIVIANANLEWFEGKNIRRDNIVGEGKNCNFYCFVFLCAIL